jgi:hypothetical protein
MDRERGSQDAYTVLEVRVRVGVGVGVRVALAASAYYSF